MFKFLDKLEDYPAVSVPATVLAVLFVTFLVGATATMIGHSVCVKFDTYRAENADNILIAERVSTMQSCYSSLRAYGKSTYECRELLDLGKNEVN